MNWHKEIRSDFTLGRKSVDDTVIEELVQHAAAAGGEDRCDYGTEAMTSEVIWLDTEVTDRLRTENDLGGHLTTATRAPASET